MAYSKHVPLVAQFGPVTVFTNGEPAPTDAGLLSYLKELNVTINTEPIVGLEEHSESGTGVRLQSGLFINLGIFYLAPSSSLSPLVEKLGLAVDNGPTGPYVKTDMFKATNVPGVYAVGDLSSPAPNLSLAIASGTMAGVGCHMSLLKFPAH